MAMAVDRAFASTYAFVPMQPQIYPSDLYWGCMPSAHLFVPSSSCFAVGSQAYSSMGVSDKSATCQGGRGRRAKDSSRQQIAMRRKESEKSATVAASRSISKQAEARTADAEADVDSSDSWEALQATKPVGSRRWADIESDDDEDDDVDVKVADGAPLTGRAAKRQRQRLRRRLGRAEVAVARFQARAAIDDSSHSTEVESTHFGAEKRLSLCKNLSEEASEVKITCDEAGPALPETDFTSTPGFERYRIAYRSFRLGNAVGAKGEVSDLQRDQKDASPMLKVWSAFLTSLNLSVAHA